MTPLIAPPPEPVRTAVEVNVVLRADGVSGEARVTVTTEGDRQSFTTAPDDVFPEGQRLLESGINYREWAPSRVADAKFASKLDFLEFLD